MLEKMNINIFQKLPKIIIFIKILTYSKNYNFIINYYMSQKAYASPHRHENVSPYAFTFKNIDIYIYQG